VKLKVLAADSTVPSTAIFGGAAGTGWAAGVTRSRGEDRQIMPAMTMAKMARKARIRARVVRICFKPDLPWLHPSFSVP